MTASKAELEEELGALRVAYAEALPGKILELDSVIESASVADRVEDACDHLQIVAELAHKLAGSGGSFGYGDVGELARQIETICFELVGNREKPFEGRLAEIREILENIKRKIGDNR